MPFLSALEVVYDDALYKSTFTLLLTVLCYSAKLSAKFSRVNSRPIQISPSLFGPTISDCNNNCKNDKKVILLSITLIFRQCDGV